MNDEPIDLSKLTRYPASAAAEFMDDTDFYKAEDVCALVAARHPDSERDAAQSQINAALDRADAEDATRFGAQAALSDDRRAAIHSKTLAMEGEVPHCIGPLPDFPEVKESGQVYGIIDPDYGRIYTMVRKLAWEEGYAIGLHGSFTRDLDMIAVPWEAGRRCNPEKLVARIIQATGLREQHGNPGEKPHGRKVWTLLLPEFGDPRFIDLSIITDQSQQGRAAGIEEAAKLADDIINDSALGAEAAAAIRALNKTGAA